MKASENRDSSNVISDHFFTTRPIYPAHNAPLTRYRCDIAYDGSCFHGWARQNTGVRTVAQELEEKLSLILEQPVHLTVAGRTDKGVHARGQVTHVDLSAVPALNNLDRFIRRCAKFLPSDIKLLKIIAVPDTFDARFSALSRYYTYTINNSPIGPLPFDRQYVTHILAPLDVNILNNAAQALVGYHDFAGFCRQRRLGSDKKGVFKKATTLRQVYQFSWTHDWQKNTFTAHLKADAFCWSMVRALVGAVVSVGCGKKSALWITELLSRAQRQSDVPIFPAQGLCLEQVEYPSEELYAQRSAQTRAIREADLLTFPSSPTQGYC